MSLTRTVLFSLLLLPLTAFGQRYLEDSGVVSIEAENYTRQTNQNGDTDFTLETTLAGESGDGYMQGAASPYVFDTEYTILEFDVTFESSATRYIWVRMYEASATDDSWWVGLGSGTDQRTFNGGSVSQWVWVQYNYTAQGAFDGDQTIRITRHEPDFKIDKVVVASSGAYDPSSVNGGLGPDESECSGCGGSPEPVKAFPSAEGFGKDATGGRGGIVCHVNSLADGSSGNQIASSIHYEGTFKYCLDTLTVARTIVFDVGGVVQITGGYGDAGGANDGDVTIACHTAPGDDGIVFAGTGYFRISKQNVIMRFCRVRSSNSTQGFGALKLQEKGVTWMKDIIIDHSSILWHVDEPFGLAGGSGTCGVACRVSCVSGNRNANCIGNVTVQYSIIGEAIGESQGGAQSKVMLLYSQGPASFVRNLVANSSFRMPMHYDGTTEYVNNMFYNGRSQSGPGIFHGYWADSEISLIGNGWIAGPHDTDMRGPRWRGDLFSGGAHSTDMFLSGNRNERDRPADNYDEDCIWGNGSLPSGTTCTAPTTNLTYVSEPVESGMILTTDPIVDTFEDAAQDMVSGGIQRVGPYIPRYDEYDQRNVNGVIDYLDGLTPANRRGTITWISGSPPPADTLKRPANASQANALIADMVATWDTATRAAGYDSDWDGIPDTWEDANGLDDMDEDDGAETAANGYTNLENYLNEVAGDTIPDDGGGDPITVPRRSFIVTRPEMH